MVVRQEQLSGIELERTAEQRSGLELDLADTAGCDRLVAQIAALAIEKDGVEALVRRGGEERLEVSPKPWVVGPHPRAVQLLAQRALGQPPGGVNDAAGFCQVGIADPVRVGGKGATETAELADQPFGELGRARARERAEEVRQDL